MSGTYRDAQAPKAVTGLFLVVALAMVLVPSVGMLWARTDSTTENRELAAAPSLAAEDGSFNVGVLADAGTYFDDHFAYRNQLVAANAHLRSALGASATDQVIVGSGDWLYYGGTLNDYLGRSELSDRSLANIVHNLQLTQGYATSKGAAFAFAIAPNKNTLYDGNMPAYFVRSPNPSNAERLKPLLEQAGVKYVDLFALFESQGEVMYLQRDTHWDNRGALLAANALLASLGRSGIAADPDSAVVRDDFVGDLQDMLYPGEGRAEPNYYFEGFHEQARADSSVNWEYVEGSDPTDSWVRTVGAGEGGLFAFRDSFGNALVPLLAGATESATFSKLVPYNVPAAVQSGADAILIERAERHVQDLATDPPIMPSPVLRSAASSGLLEGAREVEASLQVTSNGPYWVVQGSVDEQLPPDAHLYLCVQGVGSDAAGAAAAAGAGAAGASGAAAAAAGAAGGAGAAGASGAAAAAAGAAGGAGAADAAGAAGAVVYDPFWVSIADESGVVQDDSGLLAYIATSALDASASDFRVYVK